MFSDLYALRAVLSAASADIAEFYSLFFKKPGSGRGVQRMAVLGNCFDNIERSCKTHRGMVSYDMTDVIADEAVDAFSHLLRFNCLFLVNSRKMILFLACKIRLEPCKLFVNIAGIGYQVLDDRKHLQRLNLDITHVFSNLFFAHQHRSSIDFSSTASAHTLSAIPPKCKVWLQFLLNKQKCVEDSHLRLVRNRINFYPVTSSNTYF